MQFDREKSAGYMTNWAARLFAREIDRKLSSLGLSSGYLPVFFALARGSAMTQKQLAEAASVEQPTMAFTLSRMERDGLIVRKPDPKDHRSALVQLSPAAKEKAEAVREAVLSVNSKALGDMTDDERQTYLSLLRRVVSNLEEL